MHWVSTSRYGGLSGLQNANFIANVLTSRLEAGYGLPVGGGLTLTPYAANQAQAMWLPDYSETSPGGINSALSLNYAARSFTTDRVELGARMDYALPDSAGALKIFGRLAWAHDFNNGSAVTAAFQSLPGNNFLVNGVRPAPDGALTTIGARYSFGDGWTAMAKFEGEFSSTTSIYAVTGGIRKTW